MKPRGGAVSAHVPLLPAPVGKAGQGDVIETTSAAGNVPPPFRREQKSDGAVTGAAQIGAGLREEQKKNVAVATMQMRQKAAQLFFVRLSAQ